MIYLSTLPTSGKMVVCYFLVALLKGVARIRSVNGERGPLTVSCTLLRMTQEIFSVDKIVTNFYILVYSSVGNDFDDFEIIFVGLLKFNILELMSILCGL